MTTLLTPKWLVAASLFITSNQAFANCDNVPAVPIVPDGNVASMDELVAAQKALKTYQASLQEHRVCLQKLQAAIDPETETASADIAAITDRYNATVDSETAIADEFNEAVKAYKARNPQN